MRYIQILVVVFAILFTSACEPNKELSLREKTGSKETENWKPSNNQKPVEKKEKGKWQIGEYKGLIMGKSTREDMLRILGEPKECVFFKEHNAEWCYFRDETEFKAKVMVSINKKKNKISFVQISPDTWLAINEAIGLFGDDFVFTQYAFDDCLGDWDSAPLYEAPNAPDIEYMEYRKKGIALSLTENKQIREFEYISEPIGSPKSRCGY